MSCTHEASLDVEKLCFKLNTPKLTNSVTSSTIFCEKCQIGLPNIWICLDASCKFKGCGRMQNKHAQGHFTTTRHPLYFNPKTGSVWCLECETELYNDKFALFRAIFGIKDSEKPAKSKSKGVCGLKNLGNTCYLNSGIQCLSNIHAFSRFFRKIIQLEELKSKEIEDLPLLSSLKSLFQDIWKSQNSLVNPKDFLDAFRQSFPYFQGMAQHDSQEFLRIFLDKLHETLKFEYETGKFRSIVSDIFKSEVCSKVTCSVCAHSISKTEDYYDISLSIPSAKEIENYKEFSEDVMTPRERISLFSEKHTLWNKIQQVFTENKNQVSVYDCLLNFCLPEEMKSEFACPKCSNRTSSKREVKISRPANTLVFVVKRFKYNKAGVKISTYVHFPATIDLRFFLAQNKSCEYQLTGMIQHGGGLSGGHYVSFCKNYKTNKWFEFDDSRTGAVNLPQVLEKEAYVLFYQKKITEPREKPRISEKTTLLPSYWLNLYQTVSDPGPISTAYLVCPHNNIKPQYCLAQFTQVSIAQEQMIKGAFKSDWYQIKDIQECDECLNNFSAFVVRAELELELIDELNQIREFEGPWFLVSSRWLESWKRFCRLDSFKSLPDTIDNDCLLKKGKPKKNLEKGVDYRGVNRHVWEAFKQLYGKAVEIMRMKVDIYSEPVSEWNYTTPSLTDDHRRKLDIILNLQLPK